jgi:DNA primase
MIGMAKELTEKTTSKTRNTRNDRSIKIFVDYTRSSLRRCASSNNGANR